MLTKGELKMRVWIISQFTESIDGNTSNRYTYIYNKLKSLGYDIKFITSDFDHVTKKKKVAEDIDLVKIKELGYRSNISPIRMYSHLVYSWNAYKYMKQVIKESDIVLVALPSNFLGYLLAKHKKKINFKLLVDIHDMWPESLIPLMPNPLDKMGFIIWWVWKKFRIKTVNECDYLLAESVEYESLNKPYLKENIKSEAILLGADMSVINNISQIEVKDSIEKFKVVFAGNLGVNYDIETTLGMIGKYHKELLNQNIEFYFFGNGVKEKEVDVFVKKYPNIVKHLDRVPYNKYIGMLKGFDLGLNSFQKHSAVRYSYKSVDYLVSNLPVLSNLQGEFANDIKEFKIGKNYDAGNIDSLYSNLIQFKEEYSINSDIYKSNVNNYVALKLDRNKIYSPLFNFIKSEFDKYNREQIVK